ncbi:unnamed protein product [Peniophora sp. CBMAI 1063]|nr:unnamed protein product [Peniophora sp. CBMAI 1063]
MSNWELDVGSTPILNDKPNFLTEKDAHEPFDLDKRIRHFERLLTGHGRHPYLLVRLADALHGRSAGQALALLEEAQRELTVRNIEISPEFSTSVNDFRRRWERTIRERKDMPDNVFSQPWIPVSDLRSPKNDLSPDGHAEVQSYWAQHFPKDSELLKRYLRAVAIETNHIEGAFLVTPESAKTVIRDGISASHVIASPRSAIQDESVIATILEDTLSAYSIVYDIVEDPYNFTPETICEAHRRVMDTARFECRYVPAGVTRSITRNVVGIHSGDGGIIQCCPPERVDQELAKICGLTRDYLKEGKIGPFALASWLHLALARCHPFNDGNGRITRLFASVPLAKHGYPPILVPTADKVAYFNAINQAYKGDFVPLAQCFVKGMQAGMDVAGGED